MSAGWTAGEAAQADYEQLRRAVLAGLPLIGTAARRFDRCGLAGLITWPVADPEFDATLVGAARPTWTPHTDPRDKVLAGAYALLLAAAPTTAAAQMRQAR